MIDLERFSGFREDKYKSLTHLCSTVSTMSVWCGWLMPYETADPESRLCYHKVHFLTMSMLGRFTRNCVLVAYASDITNCCALQRLARH